MARGRLIACSLSTSRKFAELGARAGKLGEFAQALYPLIVVHADDFGRSSGDVFTVKHAVFPISPRALEDFGRALDTMVEVGLLRRWEAAGQIVVEVADFERHQSGLHKRTRSRFPDPPGVSGNVPEIPSEEKGRELKGTEGKGTEEGASPAAPPPPAGDAEAEPRRLHPLNAELVDAADFSAFWSAWPVAHRVGKKQATDAWKKLAAADREAAVDAVTWRVRNDPAWRGPQPDGRWAIPHPWRFLRDRRFEDERVLAVPVATGKTAGNRAAHDAYVATLNLRDAYDRSDGWCSHDPRCPDHAVHAVMLARNGSGATRVA